MQRIKYLKRWSALRSERSSWDSHWQDIGNVILPRSVRLTPSERNKGDKKHKTIYDGTAIRALDELAAGLMSGMTSPARPWFRLTTGDPELDESTAVKQWLADVTRLLLMTFAKSNTYRALHTMYKGLGAFGTASSIVLPNYKSVIHHYPLPIGEYCLAQSAEGKVNTLYREFDMTAAQMVERFGMNKVSHAVRNMIEHNNEDGWVTVYQCIAPRTNRQAGKRDNLNKAFKSVYFESGGNEDQLLGESGFDQFPGICPRWEVTGGDVYGESPGMKALGEINGLMLKEKRKQQAIDYKTRPPTQAPTSARGSVLDLLPGGQSFVDTQFSGGGIRTAFEVNLELRDLQLDIAETQQHVREFFFADLFLMLANRTSPQMTATEVAERHEEKLLMLGPVLERLHNEILEPLIETAFDAHVTAGTIPPPPEELQGFDLNVEFVSMLAQAQKAVATNSIDRFVGNLGAVAAIKPEVLDKFDADKWADKYADATGVDPDLIVSGKNVAMIRQARAQQMAQQQAAEQAAMAAETASKLGNVNTAQPNLLTDVTANFSGYT